MAKRKYVVVDGKHALGVSKETGEQVYARKGSVIDLDEAEAAKFPGKFKLQEIPAPPVEKKEEAKAPAAPAPAAPPAPPAPK